jgi:hypothetical protein
MRQQALRYLNQLSNHRLPIQTETQRATITGRPSLFCCYVLEVEPASNLQLARREHGVAV